MPPKAKGKKSQKAVKDVPLTTDQLIKKSIETLTSRHASVVDRLISNQSINQYVYLTLHLYECPYIKHDWVVNQSTTLSTIIDRLESVHGSTKSIRLYRMMSSISQSVNQSIHHEFELTDRTLSLADLGCVAGPRYPVNQSINQNDESNDVPVVRYDIIYDFLPTNQSPILMREPNVSHIEGSIDGLTDRLADQSINQPTNEAIQLLPYVGTHLQDSSFHGQRFHNDQPINHPTRQSINRPIGHISSMYAERFHGDHLINPSINQSNSDDDDSYDDTPVASDKSKAFAALLA